MKFIKKHKKIIFLFASIIFVVSFSKVVFAAWSGTFYEPGDTLEPECIPSQTDCNVRSPLTSLNIDNTAYGVAWDADLTHAASKNALYDKIETLQSLLVSGTNIKTINSVSLLGSGDITISSGLTIGSTAIASGTSGRVLYNNAGVLGEMTTTGSGTVLALATSPTLVTPVLGAATYTTLSGGAITNSALTSGRVTFASTAGLMADDADLTFATDTLSATKLLSSTSVSTPSLISTGAITMTPASGSNLNVSLATTGDFVVNTNQLYVDTSAAMVGIGVVPQTKLDLYEGTASTSLYLWMRNASTPSGTLIGYSASSDFNIRQRENAPLTLWTNNTERLTINGNGNVTLGDTSSISRLAIPIAPTASANYGLVSLGSGAFDGSTSGFFTGSANGTGLAMNLASGSTSDLLNLQIAGVNKFRVFNDGSVGIGTSTTRGTLDVRGSIMYQSDIYNNAYWDGDGFTPAVTGYSNWIVNTGGEVRHYVGPLTTAGNDISYAASFYEYVGGNVAFYGPRVQFGGTSSGFTALVPSATTLQLKLADNSGYGLFSTGATTINTSTANKGALHIPVAPGASANYGLVSLGSGAFDGSTSGFFVGAVAGTGLAMNLASGSTSDLMNLQIAGSSKFKVANSGSVIINGTNDAAGTFPLRVTGDNTNAGIAIFSNSNGLFAFGVNSNGGYAQSGTTGKGMTFYNESATSSAQVLGAGGTQFDAPTSFSHTFNVNSVSTVTIGGGRLTMPVAPTATANYGLVSLGSGPFDGSTSGFFAGSSSGTLIAGNLASGSTSDFFNFKIAGQDNQFVARPSSIYDVILTNPSTSGSLIITGGAGVVKFPVQYNAFGGIANASGSASLSFRDISSGEVNGTMAIDGTAANGAFTWVGKIGIGDATPDFKLDVETDVASSYVANFFNDGNNDNRYGIVIQAGADSATATKFIQFNDGDGTDAGSICGTAGVAGVCAPSDARLKENITDTGLSLDTLMNIKVRDFEYISDESNRVVHGFIAQELFDQYPDAVYQPTDTNDFWKVNAAQLIPLLVKSTQEINLKVAGLEAFEPETPFVINLKNWLASTTSGIEDFFSKRIHTEQLCVKKSDGTEFCANGDQLENAINNINQNTPPQGGGDNNGGGNGGDNSGSTGNEENNPPADEPSGDEPVDDGGSGEDTNPPADGSSDNGGTDTGENVGA